MSCEGSSACLVASSRSSFFWGSYHRQLRPETRELCIQRIRCLSCSKTHAVLPAFLLGQIRFGTETLSPYFTPTGRHSLSLAQVWKASPSDGPLEVSTIYRWFRRMRKRLAVLLPLLRDELLNLAPHTDLTALGKILLNDGAREARTSSAMLSPMALCQSCYWLSESLLAVSDELLDTKTPLTPLVFLNHFCWLKTGAALLAPPAKPPPHFPC